jgi:hypothetical protein
VESPPESVEDIFIIASSYFNKTGRWLVRPRASFASIKVVSTAVFNYPEAS